MDLGRAGDEVVLDDVAGLVETVDAEGRGVAVPVLATGQPLVGTRELLRDVGDQRRADPTGPTGSIVQRSNTGGPSFGTVGVGREHLRVHRDVHHDLVAVVVRVERVVHVTEVVELAPHRGVGVGLTR